MTDPVHTSPPAIQRPAQMGAGIAGWPFGRVQERAGTSSPASICTPLPPFGVPLMSAGVTGRGVSCCDSVKAGRSAVRAIAQSMKASENAGSYSQEAACFLKALGREITVAPSLCPSTKIELTGAPQSSALLNPETDRLLTSPDRAVLVDFGGPRPSARVLSRPAALLPSICSCLELRTQVRVEFSRR